MLASAFFLQQEETAVFERCDTSVVTTTSLQTTKRSNRSKSTMTKYNTIREYIDFLSNSGKSDDEITNAFGIPEAAIFFFEAHVVDDGAVRSPDMIAHLVQDALTARRNQPVLPASINAAVASNDGGDAGSSVGSRGAASNATMSSAATPTELFPAPVDHMDITPKDDKGKASDGKPKGMS
jgi:hypothetical protein